MKKYNIGVDIGASHVSCGLYNIYEKRLEHKIYLLNKMDKTIEIEKSTKKFIEIIKSLIDNLQKECKFEFNEVSSIGLACPGGNIKEEGIFLGSRSLNVTKINWRIALEKYGTKVFTENDCTCAGICEYYINAWDEFVMFTLGSGLGISYMKNGKCISEVGWDISKLNKGVGEKYDKYINSFEGLSKRYNRIKNKKYARTEIFRCIEKNDIDAKILLQEYIRNFIGGIKKIESVYGIGKYSIGGGMSEYDNYFFDKIKENLPGIDIRIAKYKNDSGIIGATMLEYIQ